MDGPSDPSQQTHEAEELGAARAALTALQVAISICRLYDRPVGQPGFDRALSDLEAILRDGRTIHFAVGRPGFYFGDSLVSSKGGSFERLAMSLFEKGVKEVTIRSLPEPDELVAFAALITEDSSAVESLGGPRGFLLERGVVSINVVDRELEIAAPEEEEAQLPDPLRRLLSDQETLAAEVERQGNPQDAYARLEELVAEANRHGMDNALVYGALADTVAAMTPDFKNALVGEAMQRFPEGLAVALTGQLSDGDLTDALVTLSRERGAELAMAYAVQVVENSNGRRGELPIIVSKRLITEGFDKEAVLKAFGTDRLLGNETPGLKLEDIVGDTDLEDLRSEANLIGGDEEFTAGLSVLATILSSERAADEDFKSIIAIAENSIRNFAGQGHQSRSLALLETLATELDRSTDPKRQQHLEKALQAGTAPEIVDQFLGAGRDETASARYLKVMQQRCIPVLLQRLAEEEATTNRRTLIDILVYLGRRELSLIVASINDPRWFFVRNLAVVLGRIQTPEAMPYLIKLTKHTDARVRKEAIRALSAFPDESASSTVCSALTDTDSSVRLAAIAALGAVPFPSGTRCLIEFLTRKPRPSITERKQALNSLWLKGSEEGLSVMHTLAKRRWPPTSSTKQVAEHARDLLSRTRIKGS